jgi:hypothetical protein
MQVAYLLFSKLLLQWSVHYQQRPVSGSVLFDSARQLMMGISYSEQLLGVGSDRAHVNCNGCRYTSTA